MKIILDGQGGDHSPLEAVKGAFDAVREYGVEIILVGKAEKMKKVMLNNSLSDSRVTVIDAPDEVGMEDDPTSVVRTKKDSSMAVGLRLLKEDGGDAFVSAGSTGALLIGATLIVRNLPGVRRGALGTVLPTAKGGVLLIDCGANVECTAEALYNFGVMGSAYMEKVMGIKNPRVGLLNVGTEDLKGTDVERQALALLRESPLNFVGNVEGRDLGIGNVDVAVSDGFTGNVLLKTVEGYGYFFNQELKKIFTKSAVTKLASVFVRSGIKEFRGRVDYKEYGGAPIMGIAKPVIKAHGSSDAKAFKNAVRQAIAFVSGGVNEKILEGVKSSAAGEENDG